MKNDKIRDMMYDMKKELLILGLKGAGLTFASIPVIVIITVLFQIPPDSGGPTMLGIITVFFVYLRYTVPNTKKIAEKYKKLVAEEIDKRRLTGEDKEG